MHIEFVEVANFRKLKGVRIVLHRETTLLVGANNSGKTSAMLALRYFLRKRGGFSINDFTLSHHSKIRDIGEAWIATAKTEKPEAPSLSAWNDILPCLDVWLNAKDSDLHYVSHILPTLDWSGGRLGVRLRLQPTEITALYHDFIEAISAATLAKEGAKNPEDGKNIEVALWPRDLVDFLGRRFSKYFKIAAFILDPAKVKPPEKGIAALQPLEADIEPLERDPFEGLLQIDEIPAQRGFADTSGSATEQASEGTATGRREARKLAKQFTDYFSKHLNPQDKPVAADILALKAIEDAQRAFDTRLKSSFAGPLHEMEGLGYPGITDPRVSISTRLRPIDGLDHDAAIQYEVAVMKGAAAAVLPEDYNGLGYQNLISMVFRLMSFRDAWMRVGKAKSSEENSASATLPPIHLILIEEPEAHLHAQVQQVFIRKAYGVLRNNKDLCWSEQFATQLVVSTHSSHVAHEVEFQCVRYFRRFPAGYPDASADSSAVPFSTVINLTDAFGDENETSRFAKRYLRATHCDLFFADAAIFIEGTAERILLPHFVRKSFEYLSQCYITWLEVGGSHAHRLQPLIDRLGLLTLIITDLDASDPAKNRKACRPAKGKALETSNSTLRNWLPRKQDLDTLLTIAENQKIATDGPLSAVRVAYQEPVQVERKGIKSEVTPYTFEDAIVFENMSVVGKMTGGSMTNRFAQLVNEDSDADTLATGLFEALESRKKAEFALDVLEFEGGPEQLRCPDYVSDGLRWLEQRLKSNKAEVLAPVLDTAQLIGDALAQVSESAETHACLDDTAAVMTDPGVEG